jgi:hypothetical protein
MNVRLSFPLCTWYLNQPLTENLILAVMKVLHVDKSSFPVLRLLSPGNGYYKIGTSIDSQVHPIFFFLWLIFKIIF